MANATPRSISISYADGRKMTQKTGPLTVTTTDSDNSAMLYYNPILNGEVSAAVTHAIKLGAQRAVATHRGMLGGCSVRVTTASTAVELHVKGEAALAHWVAVFTPSHSGSEGTLPLW